MGASTIDLPAFRRVGEFLHPAPFTQSGWGPMLIGRYVAALIASAAEPHGEELHPARLTVDLFKPVPLGPTSMTCRVVRAGRRIRVIDVDVLVEGTHVARGTVVFLARGGDSPAEQWLPPRVRLPEPDSLVFSHPAGGPIPWDQRQVGTWGSLAGALDRAAWYRESGPFIEGEATTPFVQAALCADLGSGVVNAHPTGLHFINADLTLTLATLPRGPWMAMVPISRAVDGGVAVGTCDVYDESGRLGQVSYIALVDPRNTVVGEITDRSGA
ncbi:MAG: thioesterase family protein [Ilumatobacteraceae bacterium]